MKARFGRATMNGAAYLLAVVAGLGLALQQVVNANLRVEVGSPWWAALISFGVGILVLSAAVIWFREPAPSGATLVHISWMSWTGGILGAAFVGTAIVLVPRLGAATVMALFVIGQMVGSLAFDHFGVLGVPQHPANPIRLSGALLLVLGVVLIRF